MGRKILLLIGTAVLLSGCVVQNGSDLGQANREGTPSRGGSSVASEGDIGLSDQEVQIWSLGGNGWAVRIGQKVLVFDYVSRGDPDPPGPGEQRNLANGYIDPQQLKEYQVYVLVTHSHWDHFDQVIFEWQDQIDQISYIFGWQAGSNPEHYYLADPRSHLRLDDLEIYTINSFSDVPEVAYLIQVEGLTLYINGDYQGSYREDFEYLRSISDQIDIAFMIGWPYQDHQNFQQAELLIETFHPTYLFAICREGNEDKSQQFAEMMLEQGVESQILYPEQRGADFTLPFN